MVCQCEDCIDVLSVVFETQFDFCILLDHSQGHDRKKGDGLNADIMTKNFSGSHYRMHNTDPLDPENIGPYKYPQGLPQLKQGDTQIM